VRLIVADGVFTVWFVLTWAVGSAIVVLLGPRSGALALLTPPRPKRRLPAAATTSAARTASSSLLG
jgi:hypothetical protein